MQAECVLWRRHRRLLRADAANVDQSRSTRRTPCSAGPELDDEPGGLGVEPGDDHLGDIGDDRVTVGLFAGVGAGRRD
jgi:hypothetical protein